MVIARGVLEKARDIRLVLTDCDGVLTDAGIYYSRRGPELMRFSRRDGMGVERLRAAGIETGVISREDSPITARRAKALNFEEVHFGIREKLPIIERLAAARGLSLSQVAYLGDDVNDLAALRAIGLSGCPADAEPMVQEIVDYICTQRGGCGAFREVAELVLGAQQSDAPPAEPAVHIVGQVTPARRWVAVGSHAIGEGEHTYVI